MSGFRKFIAANPAPRLVRCAVCVLPERDEIDAEYRGGNHSIRDILRYLGEQCGHTSLTRHGLDNHLTRGHWKRDKPKRKGK